MDNIDTLARLSSGADLEGDEELLVRVGHNWKQVTPDQMAASPAFTGRYLPPSPDRVPRPRVTWFERFQSGHGWTIQTGGGSITDDTTDYSLGSQSISFDIPTDNTVRTIHKASGYTFDSTDRYLAISMKLSDVTDLAELFVYGGDGGFVDYYLWDVFPSGGVRSWFQSGEWATITLSFADATVFGTPARNGIDRIRIRTRLTNGGNPCQVNVGGIGTVPESTVFPNGVVSIVFDDLYESQFTEAHRYMSTYGYPGTIYSISDRVGTELTLDQLRILESVGWEIAVHGDTNLTTLSLDAAEADATAEQRWIIQNGLSGWAHYAYPNGGFSADIGDMMRSHFTTARTIYGYTKETLPPADPIKLRCRSVAPGTSVATIEGEITAAYNNAGWYIINFHDLVAASPTGVEYLISDFEDVIDHIDSTGIPVRTVDEVIRALT